MKLLFLFLALAAPLAAGDFAAICYHRFGIETPKDPYRISQERLAGQLDWLKQNGWQGVTLAQVAAACEGGPALPSKAVLLTVDDGYASGADVATTFETHGFSAAYFVYPQAIGRKGFMSWEQLKGLEKRGHAVASHSLSHPNLAKVPVGRAPQDFQRWLKKELEGSRLKLEKGLGHPVQDLAWPFGAYNEAVIRAAQKAGYKRLYSVNGVLADSQSLDPTRLPRILLMGHPSLEAFAARFQPSRPLGPTAGLQDGGIYYEDQAPPAKKGFHFLEQGRDRLLYQVAPAAWRPHFSAL